MCIIVILKHSAVRHLWFIDLLYKCLVTYESLHYYSFIFTTYIPEKFKENLNLEMFISNYFYTIINVLGHDIVNNILENNWPLIKKVIMDYLFVYNSDFKKICSYNLFATLTWKINIQKW
jgi:hypothetical protein